MASDQISLQRLATLHPVAVKTFTSFYEHLCKVSVHKWRVTAGFRTFDEQDKLYKAYAANPGRAAKAAPAGLSYHNYGLAIDVLPMTDDFKAIEVISKQSWEMVGIVAKEYGLIWGGSFGDKPHVELHPHGYTNKTLLKWHLDNKFIKGTPYVEIPPF